MRALESYKEDRKPVFKSSVAQFMTTIYSMEYSQEDDETGNAVGKDAGNDAGNDAGKNTDNVGIPDKPRKKRQAYFLTEKGLKMLE